MSRGVLGIVPARLASTRLPRKPLHPILGRPLIEWVWRRVEGLRSLDHAVVATDSLEVAEVCRALGAPVEMTSPSHPSGTDRVAEVAAREEYRDFSIVANIQGDEPLLDDAHVAAAIDLVRRGPWGIGTCATPIRDEASRDDPSVVKVVRASDGRALYFSRAAIPYRRDAGATHEAMAPTCSLRHVGLYAYSRGALAAWVALGPSPLERIEQLEQLRPLEGGMAIGVAVVESVEAGIDTPADVARLERHLTGIGHLQPLATQS